LGGFLGRLNEWQAQNHNERIVRAFYPNADEFHSNGFNGFPVVDGKPGALLSSGQQIEI
jgi:hypothetical protein